MKKSMSKLHKKRGGGEAKGTGENHIIYRVAMHMSGLFKTLSAFDFSVPIINGMCEDRRK